MTKKQAFSLFLAVLLCLLFLSGCKKEAPLPSPSADPHEGMIYVEESDGSGQWISDYTNLKPAAYEAALFVPDGEYINYADSGLQTLRGIDVSAYQGQIDWAAVAADGVDFAMIRAGYRGYTQGMLYEDELCRQNIEGALANGIRVGLYWFSQALTEREARAEARTVLEIAKDYDITMPIAFDWEHIGTDKARTDRLTPRELTNCALAFCQAVEEAGYTPAVYFYTSLGYAFYELDRLAAYDFWLADPGDKPQFYYDFAMWQYSYTATVPGIEAEVDLNLSFKTYE